MKGGVASANAIITVGASTGFRVTGHVTDSEGNPLEGVRVDNGATDFGEYFGSYTDSEGRYVIVNAPAFSRLIQFITVLLQQRVQIPLFVTSNTFDVDFIATQLPRSASWSRPTQCMNMVVAPHYFTITRSGEITNDLASRDLRDQRLLRAITRSIHVDRGNEHPDSYRRTQSSSFRTVNDASIEGPKRRRSPYRRLALIRCAVCHHHRRSNRHYSGDDMPLFLRCPSRPSLTVRKMAWTAARSYFRARAAPE